jgi:HEAT repeat protein
MGLSMAEGSGVSDEQLPSILRLYMWNDDKTVRAIAKSFFTKYATTELQTKVKENWKTSYRTLSISRGKFQKAIRQFLEAFRSQDDFALLALEPLIKALEDKDRFVRRYAVVELGKIGYCAVEPLIKALGDKDRFVRRDAAYALGNIGDKRAVEPLIKALEDEEEYVRSSITIALGKMDDKRAVGPLIKFLDDKDGYVRGVAYALGNIGDKRAVEPLIKALENENQAGRADAIYALRKIGDKRAVKPLIKVLEDEIEYISRDAIYALGKIGDKRAVEPLIKFLDDKDGNVRYNATLVALLKITKANIKSKEQDNIIKFLESDDKAMVMMGASMLKGILEE